MMNDQTLYPKTSTDCQLVRFLSWKGTQDWRCCVCVTRVKVAVAVVAQVFSVTNIKMETTSSDICL